MRIDILSLFPEYFDVPLQTSIIGRAQKNNLVSFNFHNLRDWATDTHGTVDDTPYGGGPGMVIKVDIVKRALDAITRLDSGTPYVILLTPRGDRLSQSLSQNLAEHSWIILLCGHYEGFDERVNYYIDQEVSVGDYVLSGGEPAALVLIDSIVRLLPGVTGDPSSPHEESHSMTDETGQPLLEYPHYTRPEVFEGHRVPDILLSGNHQAIARWRLDQAKEKTFKNEVKE
jgi:tRNA (guanine37-N1)-methyltransferase